MPTQQHSLAAIFEVADKHFGFEALRDGQAEAIASLLAGQDTMVIQHTGAGKSAIYQIAGVMLDGVTVVISPLIALQKDQVDSINSRNAPEAVQLNSSRAASQNQQTLERLKEGDFEYIFLAPEQLSKPETMEYLKESNVSLIVVDEAHCIVEWGRDFRPGYMRIGVAIERLGHPPVLALTATASPSVREEIAQRLGMTNPAVFVSGFDRPNISLRVDHFKSESEKLEGLVRRASWADKPGIIYVAARRTAETIVAALAENGVDALFYHGGLNRKDRDDIQNRFMAGESQVMVATNAFGMGIDKADIRFVYHYDICDSLDAYYQEIGRAGRDGEQAEAALFYRHQNLGTHRARVGHGKLDVADLEQVAVSLAGHEAPLSIQEVVENVSLSQRKVEGAIQRLADSGVLDLTDDGAVALREDVHIASAAEQAADAQLEDEAARREKLDRMREYAESKDCRRARLLAYFGEQRRNPCGNCDNCGAIAAVAGIALGDGTRREVV